MRLPLHALRPWSDAPRPEGASALVRHALDGPLLAVEPVRDAAGTPYACDIVLQDGAYVLALCVLAWSFARGPVRRLVASARDQGIRRRPVESGGDGARNDDDEVDRNDPGDDNDS